MFAYAFTATYATTPSSSAYGDTFKVGFVTFLVEGTKALAPTTNADNNVNFILDKFDAVQ
jgi:hypothetical protein